MRVTTTCCLISFLSLLSIGSPARVAAQPLPGTKPLDWEGDIASRLVDACDAFLLQQIEASVDQREQFWQRDVSSSDAYRRSIEPNRRRLAHMLGVRDERIDWTAPEFVSGTDAGSSALIAKGANYNVYQIRWPVLEDPDPNRKGVLIYGEGLLLAPTGREPQASVIAIPHCNHTPEALVGLTEGVPAEAQFARHLAESGCRVIVPYLIDRTMHRRAVPGRGPGANLTNREYLYRSAFELGRHMIGYEVQKVLALVDWLETRSTTPGDAGGSAIGVAGYGEGGRLALFAGALDDRIDAVYASAAFGSQEDLWNQPIDRNVFGLLREFGDAQLARMCVEQRLLVVDDAVLPAEVFPGEGGAPAQLTSPANVSLELIRFDKTQPTPAQRENFVFVTAQGAEHPTAQGLTALLNRLSSDLELTPAETPPKATVRMLDPAPRAERQFDQIDLFNQLLLRESPFVRQEFLSKLDTSSLAAYETSVEEYRTIFRKDVIGDFERPLAEFQPRSRKSWETPKWTGYEVVLQVHDDVFAYGVLLLPKNLRADEKRPVVVCQHGLEGRPTDVFLDDHPAYHDFAAKLAEMGFITFAPQNIYIFKDRFRTLQRKANPLGKTLFSLIVPQHQQIVNWLKTLPNVDSERIGFYGLSYGGKSAMRIPALVTDYCLSICSADFNEWVGKNASTRLPYTYIWAGEYEIFEFDLGSTFNYAEMAALIAPRPFMVERGHFDGVGWDEWVAYEYAKVRFLYSARLHIPERTEIEFFDGPHTINGQGTYRFLRKHLDWPESQGQ